MFTELSRSNSVWRIIKVQDTYTAYIIMMGQKKVTSLHDETVATYMWPGLTKSVL